MADGKTHCQRVLFERFKGPGVPLEEEPRHFEACARQWIHELENQLATSIGISQDHGLANVVPRPGLEPGTN